MSTWPPPSTPWPGRDNAAAASWSWCRTSWRRDGWERPLRGLAARHEVLAVEVVDPRELDLPDVGVLELVDPETGAQREVQTARDLRERYAAAAGAQRQEIARRVRAAGADHLVLRTDRDWLLDIVRFVSRRKERRRVAAGTVHH